LWSWTPRGSSASGLSSVFVMLIGVMVVLALDVADPVEVPVGTPVTVKPGTMRGSVFTYTDAASL
jgi:hypothetical protein